MVVVEMAKRSLQCLYSSHCNNLLYTEVRHLLNALLFAEKVKTVHGYHYVDCELRKEKVNMPWWNSGYGIIL